MNHNLCYLAKNMFYVTFTFGALLLGLVGCTCFNKETDNSIFYGTNVTPEQEKKLLAQNTYLFGFDQYNVSNHDLLSIYAHAKRINSSPKIRVRIEGHTDNRGSRAYNIALGEKRAKAVADILFLKGVDLSKLNIVSYGMEKPISHEQNEEAWQKNRRTVIVYEKQ